MNAELYNRYLITLAQKGKELRTSQKAWYKHHQPKDLSDAKRLEKEFDKMLDLLFPEPGQTPDLFM